MASCLATGDGGGPSSAGGAPVCAGREGGILTVGPWLHREVDSMRAGQLGEYLLVWMDLAAVLPPGPELDNLHKVLGWLLSGVPLLMTEADKAAKQREPLHERKRRGLRAALTSAWLQRGEVDRALEGNFPQPVVFGNRLEAGEYLAFVRSQIENYLASGAVVQWPFAACRSHIIIPLAVAVDAYRKQRMILDARYLNWFLEYIKFQYESLSQFTAFAEPGDYMVVDDLKAGYHHARQAAECWSLLGFQLVGQLYCFTCLPFGVSQAPWALTQVLRALYALPRSLGRSTGCLPGVGGRASGEALAGVAANRPHPLVGPTRSAYGP